MDELVEEWARSQSKCDLPLEYVPADLRPGGV